MRPAVGAALSARNISLRYPHAATSVLQAFDLDLWRGEIVAVLGPSGVGKSSLLRVLAGLQKPSEGEVHVDGEPLDGVHPRVALAFQDPGLLPWLSTEKNVAFGLGFRRQPKRSRAERQARVDLALAEVGLGDARRLSPAALSGGMAQRAALARCLAREPSVLLLDEPFGALDEVTRTQMQQLLLRVTFDFDAATLVITHDIDEALLVADRIVLLGGAPAGAIREWTIALPKPREGATRELAELHGDILAALRANLPRQQQRLPAHV